MDGSLTDPAAPGSTNEDSSSNVTESGRIIATPASVADSWLQQCQDWGEDSEAPTAGGDFHGVYTPPASAAAPAANDDGAAAQDAPRPEQASRDEGHVDAAAARVLEDFGGGSARLGQKCEAVGCDGSLAGTLRSDVRDEAAAAREQGGLRAPVESVSPGASVSGSQRSALFAAALQGLTPTVFGLLHDRPTDASFPGGRGQSDVEVARSTRAASEARVLTLLPDGIPDAAAPNGGKLRRLSAAQRSVAGPPRRSYQLKPIEAEPPDVLLDGALIARSCNVKTPEAVEEVVLEGRGIADMAPEELLRFTSIRAINVDNNRLRTLAPFGELPALRTLRASCNLLADLPPMTRGFSALQVLDVSFNRLSADALFAPAAGLCHVLGLRELDASGNALGRVPLALSGWPSLRRLDLEYNDLTSDCLKPLSALPLLEHLGLAHNRIRTVPAELADSHGSFRRLQLLDLSFNLLKHAEDLAALEGLRPGAEVLIGDNPIAVKLRHARLSPSSLPHSRPGSVASSDRLYAPISVSLNARGAPGTPSPPAATTPDAVTVKVKRDVADRPTLAKSLTTDLNVVCCSADSLGGDKRASLKFDALSHDRIVAVFDSLQVEIDNWRQLATVAEDRAESGAAESADADSADADGGDGPGETGVTFLTDVDVGARPLAAPPPPHRSVTSAHDSDGSLELDEFSDPSEQLAFRLGLDPRLLAHRTGLAGTDCRGALARLKFALRHSTCDARAAPQPHHVQLTASAELKRRKPRLEPLLKLPTPESPHRKQIESIEKVLGGMKARLEQLQQEVAAQLRTYEHLVDPLEGDIDGLELLNTPRALTGSPAGRVSGGMAAVNGSAVTDGDAAALLGERRGSFGDNGVPAHSTEAKSASVRVTQQSSAKQSMVALAARSPAFGYA